MWLLAPLHVEELTNMMNRTSSTASSASASTGRRSSLTTATIIPPSTAGSGLLPAKRVEYEVEPRVRRIEQQLQEKLPTEWREFAGKPMQIQYYDKTINTFRDNENLKPSEAYMKHAIRQLREQLVAEKLSVFTDQELREIVLQEWRSDMARCVWQSRLNRHDSKDGPVVKRSRSAVVTVTAQPVEGETFILDALAQTKKPGRRVKMG